MTIPVLLVSGFLGAGKTTLVNHILQHADGLNLAAVVNDFGAIDIDASLLAQSSEGVISLRNGCICCRLQGDLMRTLVTLARRRPAPDAIVIETSGTSDPAAIVRSLLDPVIYAATPLDTVVSLVDARHVSDNPHILDDPLWRSQLRAADLVVVSKADLVDSVELERVRASLRCWKPDRAIFEAIEGAISYLLLVSRGDHIPAAAEPARMRPVLDRFETMSWTAGAPLSLPRFQAAIEQLAPSLLRAKGFLTFEHQPDRPLVFQLVGTRATIVPTSVPAKIGSYARLVLIAELGRLDRGAFAGLLDAAVAHCG